MKKLANLKNGSSTTEVNGSPVSKRNTYQMKSQSKKPKNNNPYPESGHINGKSAANGNDQQSTVSSVPTGTTRSQSLNRRSVRSSEDGLAPPTIGNKSMAPTVSTEPDMAHSDAAASHTASSGEGTNATASYGINSGRGADSTFSSPAHSVRSLTTTLTTIHSALAVPGPASNGTINTASVQFSHQFPSSPAASAIPPHLAPVTSGGHPTTYTTATANNQLTDNASILTLASSSKRRRRRSMDTDASVRALAPSSLFGGSRESLPLSLLSANIDPSAAIPPRPMAVPNERASIYSATGVAPALPSERNSYYAGRQSIVGDGGSIKSGLFGHGRAESISGSIAGIAAAGSPLASPREPATASMGRLSRNNSAFGEMGEMGEQGEVTEMENEEDYEAEKVLVLQENEGVTKNEVKKDDEADKLIVLQEVVPQEHDSEVKGGLKKASMENLSSKKIDEEGLAA